MGYSELIKLAGKGKPWSAPYCFLYALTLLSSCANSEPSTIPEACKMRTQVLAQVQEGPLKIEIIGSPVLCIEPQGDANLGPFTATARITNTDSSPVAITYTTPAFHSTGIWDAGQRDDAHFFQSPPGSAKGSNSTEKTLAKGENLLISSWTRHHVAIWTTMHNATFNKGVHQVKQDFKVQFALGVAYTTPSTPTAKISRNFVLDLAAITVSSD